MAEPQSCPNEAELKSLLDGTASDERQAAFALHLESCDACRRRLDSLAGQSNVVPPEVVAGAESPGRSEALEEAMRKLKSDAGATVETLAGPSMAPPSLAFLGPATNPRHLGQLAGYDVLEVIGRGGMGTVLKARDAKLERMVAVKVLNPDLASSGPARTRFLREARSAAAVTHEHVVTIHAVDDAGDAPFLVMEYIVGVSLEDRIQRSGHLKLEEILRIGMQIASGLAAAHAQGLVHRDIKPSNILLENGVERVKITDFGLARVVHEAQITKSNAIAGTPQYMSPEQARGEPVDHRSDLFSLGCVMYAMCVGRSPFRAETPTGAIHRVCEDTPRPIREINPEVPEWLVAIIGRLLAKKPEDRFQTAGEVSETLGQYLAHVQQPSRVQLPALSLATRATCDGASVFRTRRLPLAFGTLCLGLILIGTLELTGVTSLRNHLNMARAPEGPQKAKSGPGVLDPPPRFQIVDIQPFANGARTEPTDGNDSRNNLAELPEQLEIDGVPFQIGSRYIQLGRDEDSGWPTKLSGIAVNRRAAKLHFLHGCARGIPLYGPVAASYILHYDDGTTAELPMVLGRHFLNWWVPEQDSIDATRATAWKGRNACAAEKGCRIEVFACPQENPHPEKLITTIDFECGSLRWPFPFCLGITCDRDETRLAPEPGILAVANQGFAGSNRYSITVAGQTPLSLATKRRHDITLPPGRYKVQIRDGKTFVRGGAVQIWAGGRVWLDIDGEQALIPLTAPQPEPAEELIGQLGGINNATLSDDGKTLATAAGDGTLAIWRQERDAWRQDATLHAHHRAVSGVALSPRGGAAATGGADGQLLLWDLREMSPMVLKADNVGVNVVAFSPDGRILVSGNFDGTVDVWNVATRTKLNWFRAHPGKTLAAVFSPDGKLLATGGVGENFAKLWETKGWQLRQTLKGHTLPVAAVTFTGDGTRLASASGDSTAKCWKVETGELLQTFIHPQDLYSVAFSPDDRLLATGGLFHTVRIWDLATGKPLHDFHAHWADIRFVAFTPNGERLLSGSMDNTVRAWSVSSLPKASETESHGISPVATFRVAEDWSMCAAFAPRTGNWLAAVSIQPDCLSVWDLQDFSRTAFFSILTGKPESSSYQSLAFTPDEGTLITCKSGKGSPLIGLWDTRHGYRLREKLSVDSTLGQNDFSLASMAISGDGAVLVVVSREQGIVSAIDLSTKKSRWSVAMAPGDPFTPSFSPDGKTVAVGTVDGLILLLDARTGKEIRPPLQHGREPVAAVAFAQQGTLASAGKDGNVKLWSAESFELTTLPKVHTETLFSAAFSPDGGLLVTTGGMWVPWEPLGSHKGEICVWDVANRKLLTKLHAHDGCVSCAVFSPDGKRLATTGRGGKMYLWDVEDLLTYGTGNE